MSHPVDKALSCHTALSALAGGFTLMAVLACGDSASGGAGAGGGEQGGAGGVGGSGGVDTIGGTGDVGGGDGGVGGDGGSAPADSEIQGSAVKGPMILGSDVDVLRLDATGQSTGTTFSTQTMDELGSFSVQVDFVGPAALQATGFYFSEIRGGLSTAPITLRALYEVTSTPTQSANINVATHLVEPRAKFLWQGGLTIAAAQEQALAELVAALGIGTSTLAIGADPATLGLLADTTDSAYLFALSSVALAIAEAGGGSLDANLQAWLNATAADLQLDGQLDPAVQAQVATAESTLQSALHRDELQSYLTSIDPTLVAPDLDRVLDQDFDDAANIDDCLPFDGDRWTGNADLDGDGLGVIGCGGTDCNDDDPLIGDGADSVGDGIDQNCDGIDGDDADGDGYASLISGGVDCNDADPAITLLWTSEEIPSGDIPVGYAVDASGAEHVLVVSQAAGQAMTYGIRQAGAWALTSLGTAPNYVAAMTVESDGTVHILKRGTDGLLYHVTETGIGWQSDVVSEPTFSTVGDVKMVGTDSGRVHATYVAMNTFKRYFLTNESGTFTSTELTPPGGTVGSVEVTALSVDATEQAQVCTFDNYYPGTSQPPTTVSRCRSTAPGSPDWLSDSTGSPIRFVGVTFAPDGTKHVLSYNAFDLTLKHHWDTGPSWTAETLGTGSNPQFWGSVFAADSSGDLRACITFPSSGVQYLSNAGGTWQTETLPDSLQWCLLGSVESNVMLAATSFAAPLLRTYERQASCN